jgi:hypothetical protein
MAGSFYPGQSRALADLARQRGFATVDLPKSAFDGELTYVEADGRPGEAQTIIIEPRRVRATS